MIGFVYVSPPRCVSSILVFSIAFSIIANECIRMKKFAMDNITSNQFSSNALNNVYITFIAAKKNRRVEVPHNSMP